MGTPERPRGRRPLARLAHRPLRGGKPRGCNGCIGCMRSAARFAHRPPRGGSGTGHRCMNGHSPDSLIDYSAEGAAAGSVSISRPVRPSPASRREWHRLPLRSRVRGSGAQRLHWFWLHAWLAHGGTLLPAGTPERPRGRRPLACLAQRPPSGGRRRGCTGCSGCIGFEFRAWWSGGSDPLSPA